MQRVAIARAIVNNPKMILADEPTGALDSENSVKIMELLKKIAKDRLVIMVTHNAELAEEYATRIIKMKDGEVKSDTAPYNEPQEKPGAGRGEKRSFMPYGLAARLSLKNLVGKKIRTALTSVASSIAIVGIALVLACSNGLNHFIDKIQSDTMSSIPITVSSSDTDYSGLIEGLFGYVGDTVSGNGSEKRPTDSVIINHTLKNLVNSISGKPVTNEITRDFVDYVDKINTDRVRYDAVKNVTKRVYKKVKMPIYSSGSKDVNVFERNSGSWSCLPPERDILDEQYTMVAGRYPSEYNELLLVVDKNSSITDTVMANYLLDIYAYDESKTHYTYSEILSDPYINEYNLVLNDDYYTDNGDGTFSEDKRVELAEFIFRQYRNGGDESDAIAEIKINGIRDELKKNELIASIYDTVTCYNVHPDSDKTSLKLKIVGIIKLNDDTQYGMLSSPIAYLSSLNDKVIELSSESEVLKAQQSSPDKKVVVSKEVTDLTIESNKVRINVLSSLGYAELPTSIKFYPKTIKDKDYLLEYIDSYDKDGDGSPDFSYTDNVGAVIEIVRIVVGGVSSILIALTSISLIVSAIMIGIITYVSVIERTKEIGVLRSVGARKGDVVRLFVTETGMIGLVAGVIGIVLTLVLKMPLNALMKNITGLGGFVFLYWWNYPVIILGSALLTVIAGLIPSMLASKKDPVKALRSE